METNFNIWIYESRSKYVELLKYKNIDPYGEENWENESIKILKSKIISNFKVFEELINPYDEVSLIIYSRYF